LPLPASNARDNPSRCVASSVRFLPRAGRPATPTPTRGCCWGGVASGEATA